MESLRVLVVSPIEDSNPLVAELSDAGNALVSVQDLAEAAEALEIQRFDAVLLDQTLDLHSLHNFADTVLRFAGTPTGIFWLPLPPEHSVTTIVPDVLTGMISELSDSQSLTFAMTHLAKAVGKGNSELTPSQQSVLNVEELRSQVAFDDELLAELIDLFVCERKEQSVKLQEAIQTQDFVLLSRIAHTIKGSLASLHAAEARQHAQALESAAKDCDAELCQALLPEFEERLDEVEEQLLALKRSLSNCS